jgi:predicted heme/steroid binding protein
MAYSTPQINEILAKTDRTMYKIGSIAYQNMFSELDEALDYHRDIIYIYKKAVEWGDDYFVGTEKLDKIVERLSGMIAVWDYGMLTPIYNDVAEDESSVLPPCYLLSDLCDVNITNVQDGQYLTYDTETGKWINSGPGAAIRYSQSFTATAGQTVFVTTNPFIVGLFDLYLNGVRLNSSSFTTFGSYSITLTDPAVAGDILDIISYDANASISSLITLTTTGSTGASTLTGIVLNVPNYGLESISSASVTGTTTKTLTLTKLGGGTITASWADTDVSGYVPYTGATTNVNLGEYELKAGQLTLDVSPTGTAAVATTRWNNTTGVSETTLKGGNVILKNGVDLVVRVVNKVTPNTTLTKAAYQAVRVSGAQGQRLAVAFAQANNDNNSADTLGIVIETIPTNQEGFIMTVGQLEDINTTGSLQGETWVDGDVLYLSPTTPGALTNIKPVSTVGHIVVIGYVEYAHANNGKIYVKIMNGWELDELHNVYITSPLNNQVLKYDSATSLWKNGTITTGTVTSVDMSVPTGFSISGNPITSSGTLAIAFSSGYSLPTTIKQSNWDDAYTFVSNFPTQTGNNGKYLTTDGGTLSWGTISLTGYVQTSRTLTINGTAYDLSADRSWSVGTVTSVSALTIGTTGTDISSSVATGTTTPVITLNIPTASALNRGALSSTDWSTFNSKQDIITLTTTGSSGSSTFISNTLNIPTYTLSGLGGVSTSRSLTINGTAYDLSADRSWSVGTVTSVSALTLGTTGTDLSSTVADGTTTPVITLNVPTASATNRGALSSTDWSTFNGKQDAITLTTTGTSGAATLVGATLNIPQYSGGTSIGGTVTGGTTGSVLFINPTNTLAEDNANFFWDDTNNRLGIGTATPTADIDITRGINGAVVHQIKNTTTGTSAQAVMNFIADSNKTAQMQKLSTSFATPVAPLIAGDFAITNYSSGHMVFVNNFSTGRIKFAAGGSTTAQMSLTAAGRLLLGTTTEGTDLLDVNGTAKFLNGITINRSGTAYIILQNAGSAYLQMRGNSTYTGLDITNGAGSVRYWSFSSDSNTSGWTNARTIGRFNLLGSTSPSVVPALFAENSNLSVQNAVNEIIRLQSNITSAQMIDGFGGDIKMYIRDTDAVDNHIASISFRRIGGADNTGALYFSTANAGTVADKMLLTNNGVLSINTTSPNASAQLQVDSTTTGFLPPRMTTAQRDAISLPASGLVVYDSTLNGLCFYDGARWRADSDTIITNRQTASYTLALTDRGKLVEMNVATANNLTIPLNSSVAFAIGTKIDVVQYGAGQTTFVATGGVTIRSTNGWLKMNAQYGSATLVKIATDEWYLFGNINA